VDTEKLVEDALREVMAETTSLIVAHRPSTVMLADRVALLEAGKVTAVGTHSELLRTNAHYRYVISSLEVEEERIREMRFEPFSGAIPVVPAGAASDPAPPTHPTGDPPSPA